MSIRHYYEHLARSDLTETYMPSHFIGTFSGAEVENQGHRSIVEVRDEEKTLTALSAVPSASPNCHQDLEIDSSFAQT